MAFSSIKNIFTSHQKEAVKNILRDFVYYTWKFLSPYKQILDSKDIKHVLVVNKGVIGDLLVITPMIKALAKKYQKVDILMRQDMAEILSGNSNINKLMFYTNFDDVLKQIKGKYQLAILFNPPTYEMKNLCRQAGIKYIVGNSFSYSLSDFLLTARTRENSNEHFVQKALDQARLANADIKNPKTEFFFSKKDEAYVEDMLKSNKIKDFVAVHAGKRGNIKDPNTKRFFWPSERFAQVIDYIVQKYKLPVILTGSSMEKERNEEIMSLVKSKNVFNFCEKTTLKQWACLLKKAKLLVSLNTGATHIAAAMNTKTIVINEEFPELWHPWLPESRYRTLPYPSIEQAKEAIDEMLD
jgi:ADP-heptose:LPS heptosyltransferase